MAQVDKYRCYVSSAYKMDWATIWYPGMLVLTSFEYSLGHYIAQERCGSSLAGTL